MPLSAADLTQGTEIETSTNAVIMKTTATSMPLAPTPTEALSVLATLASLAMELSVMILMSVCVVGTTVVMREEPLATIQ
jgi:hypothetical protein